MAGDDEDFLARWSRLKREEAAKPVPAAADGAKPEAVAASDEAAGQVPAAQLPSIESLTLDSDYRAFLQPNVGVDVRRAALKKLFSDPHFHFDQMDKLDTYIDDYTKFEPISEEMMQTLDHARHLLFDKEPPVEDAPQPETAESQNKNDDPRQDP